MTDEEAQGLRRENAYLKQRCAQLQDDVTVLGGQVTRLEQQLEGVHARRAGHAANPLSGGQ